MNFQHRETTESIQLIVCRADSFLNSLLQLRQLKNMKNLDPSNETSIDVKPVRLKREREEEKQGGTVVCLRIQMAAASGGMDGEINEKNGAASLPGT